MSFPIPHGTVSPHSLAALESSGLHYCLFVKVQNWTLNTQSLRPELSVVEQNVQQWDILKGHPTNGEGGIWTLAPLLTTCTLSRGVPSTTWVLLQASWITLICICQRGLPYLSLSGESGIRTHAPFRTNGFQDRLVMTTSISLQATASLSGNNYFSKKRLLCQHFFLISWISWTKVGPTHKIIRR